MDGWRHDSVTFTHLIDHETLMSLPIVFVDAPSLAVYSPFGAGRRTNAGKKKKKGLLRRRCVSLVPPTHLLGDNRTARGKALPVAAVAVMCVRACVPTNRRWHGRFLFFFALSGPSSSCHWYSARPVKRMDENAACHIAASHIPVAAQAAALHGQRRARGLVSPFAPDLAAGAHREAERGSPACRQSKCLGGPGPPIQPILSCPPCCRAIFGSAQRRCPKRRLHARRMGFSVSGVFVCAPIAPICAGPWRKHTRHTQHAHTHSRARARARTHPTRFIACGRPRGHDTAPMWPHPARHRCPSMDDAVPGETVSCTSVLSCPSPPDGQWQRRSMFRAGMHARLCTYPALPCASVSRARRSLARSLAPCLGTLPSATVRRALLPLGATGRRARARALALSSAGAVLYCILNFERNGDDAARARSPLL